LFFHGIIISKYQYFYINFDIIIFYIMTIIPSTNLFPLPPGIIGDTLGQKPWEARSGMQAVAYENYIIRSILFNNETPEQRKVRHNLLYDANDVSLTGGIRERIDKLRGQIVGLQDDGQLTEAAIRASKRLNQAITVEDMRRAAGKRIPELQTQLRALNNDKLGLIKTYALPTKQIEKNFVPPGQTGFECVPTTIHAIGRKLLGNKWPFRTVEETHGAFEQIVPANRWFDPMLIETLIWNLYREKHLPILARMCSEPLTLMAGLSVGGMAVGKDISWAHVLLIEDWWMNKGTINFINGNTFGGGSVNPNVTLEEEDATFFDPLDISQKAVTIIFPVPE
jgi:hypothetical protein